MIFRSSPKARHPATLPHRRASCRRTKQRAIKPVILSGAQSVVRDRSAQSKDPYLTPVPNTLFSKRQQLIRRLLRLTKITPELPCLFERHFGLTVTPRPLQRSPEQNKSNRRRRN